MKIKNKIDIFIQKIMRHLKSALIFSKVRKIEKSKFYKNYEETKNEYIKNIEKYNFDRFIMPQWKINMNTIEKYFLENFSHSFLEHKIIKNTMFLYSLKDWRNKQKDLIKEKLDNKEAKEILQEYNIGSPLLNDKEYITSGNSIHHLYHLLKFEKETSYKLKTIDTILEIGGGYGNMAKINKSINNDVTYIIIDIPIFSYIQAVYLRTILGENEVHILGNDLDIKTSKINIIPLTEDVMEKLNQKQYNIDLLISTWALSESNKNMQNAVKNLDYFSAKYLLFAYQKNNESFNFAENIENITENYEKIYQKETEYTKDNYYLFCKRKNI